MGNAAEKIPLPGLPPEDKPEDITDQLDELLVEESPDLEIATGEKPADETAEALQVLKDIEEERVHEADKEKASKEADETIKAKLAEKDSASRAEMVKKMEADKRKSSMAELRGKLADVQAGKKMDAPTPTPPGFEKPAGMSDKFQHELSRAKDLVGGGQLQNGFAEEYEQTYYGVKNAEDALEGAGFFKKFGLRKKMKVALKKLNRMESEMAQAKLDSHSDKKAAAKAVELAAMTPEERAAYDKKKEIETKRAMHRMGMKQ